MIKKITVDRAIANQNFASTLCTSKESGGSATRAVGEEKRHAVW